VLFTVEADPGRLAYEGDLDRSLSRLRRWEHDGTQLVTDATLSFAGLDPFGDVQLLDRGENLLLRRRGRFDVVTVTAGGLGWGGILGRSSIPVTGSVLAAFPGGGTWMWAGSSSAAAPAGEGYTLDTGTTLLGDPLTVVSAASVPGGVRVYLAWTDPCPSTSLTRSGDMRGSYSVAVPAGQLAVDTLAIGETVTYIATSPSCPPRTLVLTGRDAPLPLAVSWEDDRTLVVDLPRPLRGSPGSPIPPESIFIVGSTMVPILSSQVVHEGKRIWIRVGKGEANSLILGRAWYADGYPVAGAEAPGGYPLPQRPAPEPDAVLAAVQYRGTDGPALEVTLGGSGEACPQGFFLEPPGIALTAWTEASPGADYTLEIPLESDLVSGAYTLRFADACLDGCASPLGAARGFSVAATPPVVYPNPVPPGADLVIENVEPGSRVEIHDLRGVPQVTFVTVDTPQRRPVTDLAPGLYLLRVEDPEGRLILLERIFIRR
jgi:hypothetical protein